MQYRRLGSSGLNVSLFSIGSWVTYGGQVDDQIAKECIHAALDHGVNFIDNAEAYAAGQAEITVGKIISGMKRSDLVISSKVFWGGEGPNDQGLSRKHVFEACHAALRRLQLDYLDLYLIHWPIAQQHDVLGAKKADDYISREELPLIATWRGMEQAQQQGLARHIGVSNFAEHHLNEIIEKGSIRPAVNQVELHPYLQQPELVAFCQSHNIHLTAYSPLGSGDRPDGMKGENEPVLFENEVIKAIAAAHDATPAQVLIAWSIHRNVSVIPKSTNPGRIEQNFAAASLELTPEDMNRIAALDRSRRYVDGRFWEVEGGPYTAAALWGEA